MQGGDSCVVVLFRSSDEGVDGHGDEERVLYDSSESTTRSSPASCLVFSCTRQPCKLLNKLKFGSVGGFN